MSTFRVRIARPTTHSPQYDWVQTVVAIGADAATEYAYANWVASNPDDAPPPLSACRIWTTPGDLPHPVNDCYH